jgi:hypothetical protein
MKTLLAALLLFPLPAFAQTLAVSAGPVVETWSLAPADQAKFEEWVQSAYPCKPVAPATTCTTVLADAETAWAQATLQGTLDNVTRYHNIKAATDAVAANPPITPVSAKKK